MTLGELLSRMPEARLDGDSAIEILCVTHDSRTVRPGWMFAALPGQRQHGGAFVNQAICNGAAAVLSDRPRPAETEVAWITTPFPRRHMAAAAWALAGDPQQDLVMVGVTGTNGKSTTVDLIGRILDTVGTRAGVFGTLGYRIPTEMVAAERTTPEATDLAPLLRRLVDLDGRVAVMEVSSHALMQDRVAGLGYQVAVWTNLSHDHLDYHGDMEQYFNAKRRLFTEHLEFGGRRVLPVDEAWGRRLLDEPQPGDVTWGLADGTVHAENARYSLEGTDFELHLGELCQATRLPLIGEHNLRNGLAAAAAALALRLDPEVIVKGLAGARPLAGRLETVDVDLPFPVLIDYAHTPDGLRSVLKALRSVSDRRLIVVFGAGGDRDHEKRRPMGRAVGELADIPLVTSDNPRTEDPAVIAAEVADGVREAGVEPVVILDRRQAIAEALQSADADSLVLVAGKGHERSQILGTTTVPFFDPDVVRELAAEVVCT